jgi:tetratricopeptide (TPR) repeat protein
LNGVLSKIDVKFRTWLFRTLSVTLIPLVALVLVESVLRLAGYGYPTGFFKQLRIGGENFLVQNDQFGLRFFPPERLRLPPPLRMRAHKSPGTIRIFIFGESAAMGDPEPAFAAGRYLEALLRERYPGQTFEVVNVAMTAINSHVILPIARDCAGQQGDLWIIYMGNNEMVGPFGAATVFGSQAPPLAVARLSLALQKTRVGQLIMALGRKLRPKPSGAQSWGGMQMFLGNRVPPLDSSRARVYNGFRSNLRDILKAGLDSGAAVVLSTVPVNLKDCPPFASQVGDLTPAAQADLEKRLKESSEACDQGRFQQAAELLQKCASLSHQSADIQFRWAECLARSGKPAFEHYRLACDLDTLPFRADSRINDLIQQAPEAFPARRLKLCDAALALSTNTPAGVPGQESFYEHVHLNFDGNYRLARAWADTVAGSLPLTNRFASDWATQDICERRLGLTDWNRCNVLEEVQRRMQLPPMSTQPNNAERTRSLAIAETELRKHSRINQTQARDLYLDALRRSPEDFRLRQNFADFLTATGDYAQAGSVWQEVRGLIPQDHVADYQLGRLARLQGKPAESLAWLSECVQLRPNFPDAWLELGHVQASLGKLDLALEQYNRALKLQPQDFQAWYWAGVALAKLQRPKEAIDHYREAVRLNPRFWQARFELGGQLGLAGNIPEAAEQLGEAVRLNPGFAMSHLNFGLALMKQGRLDLAQHEFEETLRLEPTNRLAPVCLAQLRDLRH